MIWTVIISNGIYTISKHVMTDTPCHDKAKKEVESMEFEPGQWLIGMIKGRHEIYV